MNQPRLYVVRNEVDADYEYHCDALASAFPEAEEVDFPAGERPDLDEADLADDPLFAGVSPIVQVIHGDVVTETI